MTKLKKGQKIKTPSGIITIKSIARGGKSFGKGYRIGKVILDPLEVKSNLEKGLWVLINS